MFAGVGKIGLPVLDFATITREFIFMLKIKMKTKKTNPNFSLIFRL